MLLRDTNGLSPKKIQTVQRVRFSVQLPQTASQRTMNRVKELIYDSSISTSPVARQNELKRKLRKALEDGNDASCWARIEIHGKCGTSLGTSTDIVKLLAVNSSFYSFITHGRHYQTLKADNWLVHEDEFYVHWVGEGRNAVGTPICGDELEESFFMYGSEPDDE